MGNYLDCKSNGGCFMVIIAILVSLIFSLGFGILMTKAIIWTINGIFEIDLSNKFWEVYVLYCIVCIISSFGKNNQANKGH